MIVTRLGHAALLVETDSARLLIDPGSFSDDWHGLTELDAVLITHQHADHVDTSRVERLMSANPSARIVVEGAVADMLTVEAEVGAPDDSTEVGDMSVTAVGGEHALIHPEIPRVGNLGFVITERDGVTLFHPGDALAYAPDGVDYLAVPLTAPWAKVAETVEFVRSVAAPHAFPIHDAILSEKGRAVYLRVMSGVVGDACEFHDPSGGDPLVLD